MGTTKISNAHIGLARSLLAQQPQTGGPDNQYLALAVGTECIIAGGEYTVTHDDVNQGQSTIATGLPSVLATFCVHIMRDGSTVTADVRVTTCGLDLLVANGLDYRLTAADKIEWMAFGK